MLDRPEVKLSGGADTVDVKVLTFTTELASLPSGETEKVVVVFSTPAQEVRERVNLGLIEKGGNRHVQLESVDL